MILYGNFSNTVIKLSLVLWYNLIVSAKSNYEYCINTVTNMCRGLEHIPISKYRISKVRAVDYYLDPEAKIERENYPDYLALTMIQTKGLCSFGDQSVFITNIPEIRYGRTYQCYYAYKELLCNDEETEKTSSKVKKSKLPTLCKKQCYEYYNSLVTFLNNNDTCPIEFLEEYAQPEDVYQARIQYTDKLREICEDAEDTEDCFILDSERNNCGFLDKDMAAEYCTKNNNEDDECCNYFYHSHKEIYIRNDPTIPLTFGVSTFLMFTIIGLFFSGQFIKDIKREEKNRALRSVENMFMNSNSTTTSLSSADSGSQQSLQLSLATTSDSNVTVLNGSCPNIPMIINDANNSNPALNSPVMNLYRLNNRHAKNNSSSLININMYASPPAIKSQSMSRFFRKKKQAPSAKSNQDKSHKKKKVISSSEAHQIYPRTVSNEVNGGSIGARTQKSLPYVVSKDNRSNTNPRVNNNRYSDTSNSDRIPYSNEVNSPVHSQTPQKQDIDSMSYDITTAKSLSNVNVSTESNITFTNDMNKENNINQENALSKNNESIEKHRKNLYSSKYTKRSASLHAESVKNLRFDSVKIQQMQQHILKQQHYLLQKQQQQQQQQHYYMPQSYTPKTSFSSLQQQQQQQQQLFNPQVYLPSPSHPYAIPPQIAFPSMTSPQTITPIPQQFNPQSYIPPQSIIPTQHIAPSLPIRNKSLKSQHSSSIKILHRKSSAPQMSRKYSLSALEANSSYLANKSKEKVVLRQKSLDYLRNKSLSSSSTILMSPDGRTSVSQYPSDVSNLTNISEILNLPKMEDYFSSSPGNLYGDGDEVNSYYMDNSSNVKVVDSPETMIPTVVDSMPDTMTSTLVDTMMMNSSQVSDLKKEGTKELQGQELSSFTLKNTN
ncbi:hypothetical protein BCR36DRAFT_354244 [Piromyces finnis]|uniref:FZ domain-containing protein n=1 Tax=Piromyces finnis TaxID=1754191 RepID=A0A1Y1V867_9FUNG|nr:hypothetical protein BCR36DRAFT_354244 [Piromyces finnis]|eukprot:ORX49031.1 hypothetical protein BCR36DRAFT_354244 [Piromyces finnis]